MQRTSLLSISLCLMALDSPAQDRSRGLTPLQTMALRQVLSVTSQGNAAAFVTLEPRPPEDGAGGAYTHLYGLSSVDAKPVLLAGGKGRVSNVEFRPGTEHVTFLRAGKLWKAHVGGGAVTPVVGAPAGIAHCHWRPDGKALAFTRLDPVSDNRAESQAAGFKMHIVDEDFRHLSLWLWEGGEERKLTEGRTVYHMEWRPDGKALALGMTKRNLIDDRYMFQRLHLLDLEGGSLTRTVNNPGKLGEFKFSPDGERLAYVTGADRRDPHAGTLRVVDLATKNIQELKWDFDGMVHLVHWESNDQVLAGVSEGVHTALVRFSIETLRINVVQDGEAIDKRESLRLGLSHRTQIAGRAFAPLTDGSHLVIASTSRHPNELFHTKVSDDKEALMAQDLLDRLREEATERGRVVSDPTAPKGDPTTNRRLTNLNPWLADVALGKQTVEKFTARDGLEIEGLLIHPLNYEQGKRYPMVIVVHGGPEAHFSNGWITRYSEWGQMLAARGYFAWYPNYRASTGYGVDFAKADHGDIMGGEFRDHVDAIDYFAKANLIDRNRVGIGGGSYGGYTAAWAATAGTEHFAAAVSFVPFVHVPTKWMTSDIPWEFYLVHYEEQWPWEQPGYLSDRSPLTWAHHCDTPLLLLGGDRDTRVDPSQPFMLYRAVKFGTDTPTRYVRYPGEGHGNRSNVYQYDYCIRALRWFDHYLSGDDRRSARLPSLDLDHGAWARGSRK